MSFGPGIIYVDVPIRSQVTERVPIKIMSFTTTYVNRGVTFSLPAGLYTAVPQAETSFMNNLTPYSPTTSFSVHVTSITLTSVTVRVNRIDNGGIVNEAATGEVIVMVTVRGL